MENPLGVLQIAPEVLPDEWERIRRTRGLNEGRRTAKFAAPIDGLVPPGTTDLRIAPVTKEDADRWSSVVNESFGFPPEGNHGLLAASAGHPQSSRTLRGMATPWSAARIYSSRTVSPR